MDQHHVVGTRTRRSVSGTVARGEIKRITANGHRKSTRNGSSSPEDRLAQFDGSSLTESKSLDFHSSKREAATTPPSVHPDSGSGDDERKPAASKHNTRSRNGIQKQKRVIYAPVSDSPKSQENVIDNSAVLLACLDQHSYYRDLLLDANRVLHEFVLPMSLPWCQPGEIIVRNAAYDIDELAGVLSAGDQGLNYTDHGKVETSQGDRLLPGNLEAAVRRGHDPGIVKLTAYQYPSMAQKMLERQFTLPASIAEDVRIQEPGELVYNAVRTIRSVKRHRADIESSRKKIRLVSFRLGSSSSQTSIIQPTGNGKYPLVLPAILPKEVQEGRHLRGSKVNSIIEQLGSYDCRYGYESSMTKKGKNDRTWVGRTRVMWSQRDGKASAHRQNFMSIITGERMENGMQKRPRCIKVSVRLNARVVSSGEGVAKKHAPQLTTLLNVDAPEDAQLRYHPKTVGDAISDSCSDTVVMNRDHSQCSIDTEKLLKSVMKKYDTMKPLNGASRKRDGVPLTWPKLECLPLEDGVMSVACTVPGQYNTATGTNDRLTTFLKKVYGESDLCTACWSGTGTTIACTSCGVRAHASCADRVGKTTSSLWKCSLCMARPNDVDLDEYLAGAVCAVCGRCAAAILEPYKGRWIHPICRVWCCGIEDNSKQSSMCHLCSESTGSVVECVAENCHVKFHPMCAVISSRASDYYRKAANTGDTKHDAYLCSQFRLLMTEVAQHGSSRRIKLPVAFCGYHNPSRQADYYGLDPLAQQSKDAIRVPPRRPARRELTSG